MRPSIRIVCLAFAGHVASACLDPSASGELVPKTADEDPSVPQLSFNDSTFHVQTFGDPEKPVIVFLHGGPGNDHRGLLRLRRAVDGVRLEDEHFLVFWDQRSAGLSQRHDPKDLSIDGYDRDLTWIVDHFSPDAQVVLVGHSWGGMYASEFVSRHPTRVKGLVLLESGPLTGAMYEQVSDEIQHIDLGAEGLNDYTWVSRCLSPDDHARADYTMALASLSGAQPAYHLSEDDPEHFWRMGAAASQAIQNEGMDDGEPAWDFTHGLHEFETEVLFEASALNTAIGAGFQRRQARFYPNAHVEVVSGAGHDFPWVNPAGTLRPIFEYLARLEAEGGAQ
jgi:proline iminopeptidase